MKSNRVWLPVLALVVCSLFGAPGAHAALFCSAVCSCDESCSTRCTEGPGLPTLTCGQWNEPCVDSPRCSPLVASLPATTSNVSREADSLWESIFALPMAASSTTH